MSKYLIIADSFYIPTKPVPVEHHGPVVASDEAFFLIADKSAFEAIGERFGRAAAIAGKKIGEQWDKLTDLAMVNYEDLPDELTSDPDWPVKKSSGRVMVLPKKSVAGISAPYWGAPFQIEARGQDFFLTVSLFRWSRFKKHLISNGWREQFETGTSNSQAAHYAPLIGFALGGAVGVCLINTIGRREIRDSPGGAWLEAALMFGPILLGLVLGFLFAKFRNSNRGSSSN